MGIKPNLLSNDPKHQSVQKMSKKTVAALRSVMLQDARIQEVKGIKFTFARLEKYAIPHVKTPVKRTFSKIQASTRQQAMVMSQQQRELLQNKREELKKFLQ